MSSSSKASNKSSVQKHFMQKHNTSSSAGNISFGDADVTQFCNEFSSLAGECDNLLNRFEHFHHSHSGESKSCQTEDVGMLLHSSFERKGGLSSTISPVRGIKTDPEIRDLNKMLNDLKKELNKEKEDNSIMESQISYLEEKCQLEKSKRKQVEGELAQWKLKVQNIMQVTNSNRLMKVNKSLVRMNDQLLSKTKSNERAMRACKAENEALQQLVDGHRKLFAKLSQVINHAENRNDESDDDADQSEEAIVKQAIRMIRKMHPTSHNSEIVDLNDDEEEEDTKSDVSDVSTVAVCDNQTMTTDCIRQRRPSPLLSGASGRLHPSRPISGRVRRLSNESEASTVAWGDNTRAKKKTSPSPISGSSMILPPPYPDLREHVVTLTAENIKYQQYIDSILSIVDPEMVSVDRLNLEEYGSAVSEACNKIKDLRTQVTDTKDACAKATARLENELRDVRRNLMEAKCEVDYVTRMHKLATDDLAEMEAKQQREKDLSTPEKIKKLPILLPPEKIERLKRSGLTVTVVTVTMDTTVQLRDRETPVELRKGEDVQIITGRKRRQYIRLPNGFFYSVDRSDVDCLLAMLPTSTNEDNSKKENDEEVKNKERKLSEDTPVACHSLPSLILQDCVTGGKSIIISSDEKVAQETSEKSRIVGGGDPTSSDDGPVNDSLHGRAVADDDDVNSDDVGNDDVNSDDVGSVITEDHDQKPRITAVVSLAKVDHEETTVNDEAPLEVTKLETTILDSITQDNAVIKKDTGMMKPLGPGFHKKPTISQKQEPSCSTEATTSTDTTTSSVDVSNLTKEQKALLIRRRIHQQVSSVISFLSPAQEETEEKGDTTNWLNNGFYSNGISARRSYYSMSNIKSQSMSNIKSQQQQQSMSNMKSQQHRYPTRSSKVEKTSSSSTSKMSSFITDANLLDLSALPGYRGAPITTPDAKSSPPIAVRNPPTCATTDKVKKEHLPNQTTPKFLKDSTNVVFVSSPLSLTKLPGYRKRPASPEPVVNNNSVSDICGEQVTPKKLRKYASPPSMSLSSALKLQRQQKKASLDDEDCGGSPLVATQFPHQRMRIRKKVVVDPSTPPQTKVAKQSTTVKNAKKDKAHKSQSGKSGLQGLFKKKQRRSHAKK